MNCQAGRPGLQGSRLPWDFAQARDPGDKEPSGHVVFGPALCPSTGPWLPAALRGPGHLLRPRAGAGQPGWAPCGQRGSGGAGSRHSPGGAAPPRADTPGNSLPQTSLHWPDVPPPGAPYQAWCPAGPAATRHPSCQRLGRRSSTPSPRSGAGGGLGLGCSPRCGLLGWGALGEARGEAGGPEGDGPGPRSGEPLGGRAQGVRAVDHQGLLRGGAWRKPTLAAPGSPEPARPRALLAPGRVEISSPFSSFPT